MNVVFLNLQFSKWVYEHLQCKKNIIADYKSLYSRHSDLQSEWTVVSEWTEERS